MTRDEAMQRIRDDAQDQCISPESRLDTLEIDSLELLDLMVALDVDQSRLPDMHTVADLLGALD